MYRAMISLEVKVFEIVCYLFGAGLLAQCIDSVGRAWPYGVGVESLPRLQRDMPFLWHLWARAYSI